MPTSSTSQKLARKVRHQATDLVTFIANQAGKQGPIFRLPALRPTFVFSGHEALAVLADSNCVDRSASVLPAQITLAQALCDNEVAALSLTSGAEHQRRRASWLMPGNLDREGITQAATAVDQILNDVFTQWERQRVFSLNEAVRHATWKVATRLVMGAEAADGLRTDFETFFDLITTHDLDAAKQRVFEWLNVEANRLLQSTNLRADCIANRLALSGTLSKPELINEMRHGIGGAFNLWTPLTELLRLLSEPTAEAINARQEILEFDKHSSLRAMAQTTHLLALIDTALNRCAPLPFFFARAKTAFSVADVAIPEGAVLIGALHATLHNSTNLPSSFSASHDASPGLLSTSHLAFGQAPHRCPAANLSCVIMWQFAVRLFGCYQLEALDAADLPEQHRSGYYAPGGCFVKPESVT